MNDHLTRIQFELTRVADALERIADALGPRTEVNEPEAVEVQPTLINPLLAWFATAQRAPDAVSDVDAAATFSEFKPSSSSPVITGNIVVQRGRPKNRVSHCGRCGREDTRRMNHSDSCRECVHEAWWTE
ncbi:MAG: hypothetical protein ACO20Y_08335 [Poseidonia sp.]